MSRWKRVILIILIVFFFLASASIIAQPIVESVWDTTRGHVGVCTVYD